MPPSARAVGAAVATATLLALGVSPASAIAPAGCEVADATLTWGFKESFRAYIDGGIANGEWTTEGDATYATPAFVWAGGEGRFEDGAGEVAFSGSVRFTGHGGVLDVTVSDPVLRFDGERAVLLLDVTGETMEGDPIEAADAEFADLADLEWGGADALVQLDAATTLTEEGAAAFPNYPAGEPFDPVAVDLPIGGTCDGTLPGEPDGPGDPVQPGEPADAGWDPALTAAVAGGGAALVAALAVLVVAVLRRRNRA